LALDVDILGMDVTEKQSIVSLWVSWFYIKMPKKIIEGWRNFLLFVLYYFSIKLLLKTLFSPWRKYAESYPRGIDIKKYLETFIFNTTSRVIGAIMRSFLIIGGVLCEFITFILGGIILLGWILSPVLLIAGLLSVFILI